MRRFVLLCVLTGCGRLGFDPFGGGMGGDAPRGDGASDGDAALDASTLIDAPIDATIAPVDARVIVPVLSTVCTPAPPGTTFPGGTACADWMGQVSQNGASVTESGGALTIAPAADVPDVAGQCGRDLLFDAPGVFVEISDVIDAPSGLTAVVVSGPLASYNMNVRAGILSVQTLNAGTIKMVPYDPVAMRWWRIRPITGGVVFEISADAVTWTFLTQSDLPSPHMVSVALYGGVSAANSTPGVARFEAVNVCP